METIPSLKDEILHLFISTLFYTRLLQIYKHLCKLKLDLLPFDIQNIHSIAQGNNNMQLQIKAANTQITVRDGGTTSI